MTMKKEMPKVGDRLFDKAVGNAARFSRSLGTGPQITEVEVVHVGRKYFTCVPVHWLSEPNAAKRYGTMFMIEDGVYKEKTDYSQEHELHSSSQEILDEDEAQKLEDDIRKIFVNCSRCSCHRSLSLGALRKIKEIIDADRAACD